jgi:sulfonate transport system permease protein
MAVSSEDSTPTAETSSTRGTSQSVVAPRQRTHRWLPRPLALVSFLAFIALWQFLSVVLGETATGQQVVPSIPHVARSFKTFSLHWPGGWGAGDTRTGAEETYWGAVLGAAYNTAISALRAVVGFAWGVVGGVGIALVISWSRTLREMFLYPAHFARMLPLLAMIPLFGLWFGILMFEITLNALSNVPAYYAQSASSLGASPLRIYLTVNFPAILPQLRAAILLAIPFAWSAVLASEVLANTTGLGQILNYALYYGSTDVAAITGIVVVAVASITYLVARAILGWVTRWA